jgi:hypothetical protein
MPPEFDMMIDMTPKLWKYGAVALVVLIVLGYIFYAYVYMRPHSDETGDPIDITKEPIQIELENTRLVQLDRGDQSYWVEKLSSYDISGQVLMKETYSIFYRSDLFYVDLALIWGDRVEDIISRYDFKQMGRWLFWSIDHQISPDEKEYITSHISNNHLIPAEGNWNIDKAIRWIKKGDQVRIKGYLVSITGINNPLRLKSSLRRGDSGGGACEIIWIEELQINEDIYR